MRTLNCLVENSVEIAGSGHGPLVGQGFVAKDLFAVAGHVSSFGHPRWRASHGPAVANAPVISALLEAGATMVGTAKLDQLAWSLVGNVAEGTPPLNPLYPDRFAGGSSSGSASAIAGGICDFGLGTDTAGSIRVPAAACGLYSLRPTYGSIDSTGILPLAPSFDTVGLLARHPETLFDAAMVCLRETRENPDTLEVVLLPTEALETLDSDLAEAMVGLAAAMQRTLGAKIVDASLGDLALPKAADLFARLQAREAWITLGDWARRNVSYLAPDVASRLRWAESVSSALPEKAEADVAARAQFKGAFGNVVASKRALLLPVIPGLPPSCGASASELSAFRDAVLPWTSAASLVGAPEVVVPVAVRETGRTYGVGILGAPGADQEILQAASALGGKTGCPFVEI